MEFSIINSLLTMVFDGVLGIGLFTKDTAMAMMRVIMIIMFKRLLVAWVID